jgi:glutamate 5-kinase
MNKVGDNDNLAASSIVIRVWADWHHFLHRSGYLFTANPECFLSGPIDKTKSEYFKHYGIHRWCTGNRG